METETIEGQPATRIDNRETALDLAARAEESAGDDAAWLQRQAGIHATLAIADELAGARAELERLADTTEEANK